MATILAGIQRCSTVVTRAAKARDKQEFPCSRIQATRLGLLVTTRGHHHHHADTPAKALLNSPRLFPASPQPAANSVAARARALSQAHSLDLSRQWS